MNIAGITLSKEEQIVFTLLRTVLHEKYDEKDTDLLTNLSDKDWVRCLSLAKSHGVLALVCHSFTLLPRQELMPSHALKMKCIRMLYKAECTHKSYCKTIVELEKLFMSEGVGMMVLKGVGVSSYYPIPSLRRCGDIDILCYSLNPSEMNDEEASMKADDIIRNIGIKVSTHLYKHSCFKYNGIEIENHKYLLEVKLLNEAIEMDKYLRTIAHPQRIKLYNEYEITIPSAEFNAVFIAFHASQHLGDVLSIYHLFDWACILKRHGNIIPKEVKAQGFLKFVNSFTSLSNKLLETKITLREEEEELEAVILDDLLHYPFKGTRIPKNLFLWLIYKTRTNLHSIKIKQFFYDITLWKALKKTIISHWKGHFNAKS